MQIILLLSSPVPRDISFIYFCIITMIIFAVISLSVLFWDQDSYPAKEWKSIFSDDFEDDFDKDYLEDDLDKNNDCFVPKFKDINENEWKYKFQVHLTTWEIVLVVVSLLAFGGYIIKQSDFQKGLFFLDLILKLLK